MDLYNIIIKDVIRKMKNITTGTLLAFHVSTTM